MTGMIEDTDYEEERRRNIAENDALLFGLGLDKVVFEKKAKPKPKPKTPKKKTGDEEYKPEEVRRSKRVSGFRAQTVSDSESDGGSAFSESDSEGERKATKRRRRGGPSQPKRRGEDYIPQRNAQRLGIRTQDPKQYGHIPGVEVGRWWASRMDCSTDAVHAPTVAGISGNRDDGAWSVALSGGYPDDVDMGDMFTYTGAGGRDLKGTAKNPKNLRTAAQTFDQSFDHVNNAALKRSSITRKPIRVIRGYKLESEFAPAEGYRYDGLYIVERAWMAKGLTKGLLVCRFAFKRVAGQPPLPQRADESEDAAEDEAGEGKTASRESEEDDVEEVAQVLEDATAKRGSKRKADEADAGEPPRRGRGRPRKVVPTPAATESTEVQDARRRSERVLAELSVETATREVAVVEAKRGRGGAPKIAKMPARSSPRRASAAPEVTDLVAANKRGHGRPPKFDQTTARTSPRRVSVVKVEPSAAREVTEVVAAQRGRGRPPKAPTMTATITPRRATVVEVEIVSPTPRRAHLSVSASPAKRKPRVSALLLPPMPLLLPPAAAVPAATSSSLWLYCFAYYIRSQPRAIP